MRNRTFWIPEFSQLLLLLALFHASSTIGFGFGFSFVQQQSTLKLRLNKKDCKANGLKGTCMFVSDCMRSEGHHLGICMDNFMFGSCCYHNVTDNLIDFSANNPYDYYVYSTFKTSTITPFKTTHKDDERDNMKFTILPALNPNRSTSTTGGPVKIDLLMLITKNQTIPTPTPTPTPTITSNSRPNLWYTTTEANFVTKVQSNVTTQTKEVSQVTTNTNKDFTIKLLSVTDKADCGLVSMAFKRKMRIVGGKESLFGQWPWQVSVRKISIFGFSSVHRCGGALLNENWIVTAAHCVDDLLISQIRLRIGEHDFSQKDKQYPHIELGITRKLIHPKYNHSSYEYDLALLKLSRTIRYADHINAICLPQTEDDLVGLNATVTGWGRLKDGGILPNTLHEAHVPIISNDRCKNMFLRSGRNEYLPDIFMCAGHENGGHDSCQGDSGGPLQVKNGADGRYFLAGIVSWGIGCAEPNLPGICTRISKFVPWILKNVS